MLFRAVITHRLPAGPLPSRVQGQVDSDHVALGQVIPTEGPHIRLAAVATEGENFWGRPLHRELGARGAGVLIVKDEPGKRAERACRNVLGA